MRLLPIIALIMVSVSLSAFEFPEIVGWQRVGEEERYTPDNLFEYINGAAESYLAFEFQDLNIAEYQAGEASVLVEVYQHASAAEAFGIYAQERPREGPFKKIGYQGYQSGEIFCLVADHFYIKLIGNRLGDTQSNILDHFARQITARIPDAAKTPALLKVFPQDSLEQNSETYIAQNFLGYPFFNGAFTADYPGIRLFVMDAGSHLKVKEILHTYAIELNKIMPAGEMGTVQLDDPYHGRIIISWQNNFIWGGFEMTRESAKDFIIQLRDNIQSNYFGPEQ